MRLRGDDTTAAGGYFLLHFNAYEAEKRGFTALLNNAAIGCEKLEKGPEFLTEAKAYLAICDNINIHFLRFDYITSQWKVLK